MILVKKQNKRFLSNVTMQEKEEKGEEKQKEKKISIFWVCKDHEDLSQHGCVLWLVNFVCSVFLSVGNGLSDI